MIHSEEWIKKQYEETYASIGLHGDGKKALKKDVIREFRRRRREAERQLRMKLRETDMEVIIGLFKDFRLEVEDVYNED